jgi:hypothetical protein
MYTVMAAMEVAFAKKLLRGEPGVSKRKVKATVIKPFVSMVKKLKNRMTVSGTDAVLLAMARKNWAMTANQAVSQISPMNIVLVPGFSVCMAGSLILRIKIMFS